MTQPFGGKLGVDFTETGSGSGSAPFPFELGTIEQGADGTLFMVVKGTSAITVNSFVGIDENYNADDLTKAMADDGWHIGAAQTAIPSGERGWVCVRGANVSGRLLASCAADVALYTSATAGALDDASTGQTKIDGVVAVAAASAGGVSVKEVILTWPRSTTF